MRPYVHFTNVIHPFALSFTVLLVGVHTTWPLWESKTLRAHNKSHTVTPIAMKRPMFHIILLGRSIFVKLFVQIKLICINHQENTLNRDMAANGGITWLWLYCIMGRFHCWRGRCRVGLMRAHMVKRRENLPLKNVVCSFVACWILVYASLYLYTEVTCGCTRLKRVGNKGLGGKRKCQGSSTFILKSITALE